MDHPCISPCESRRTVKQWRRASCARRRSAPSRSAAAASRTSAARREPLSGTHWKSTHRLPGVEWRNYLPAPGGVAPGGLRRGNFCRPPEGRANECPLVCMYDARVGVYLACPLGVCRDAPRRNPPPPAGAGWGWQIMAPLHGFDDG
eukprot:gene17881-biopygen21898